MESQYFFYSFLRAVGGEIRRGLCGIPGKNIETWDSLFVT
jgi:hypothetical protein